MFKLKKGVRLSNIKPELIPAIMSVNSIYYSFGLECVITSVNDSRHKVNSDHYKGLAFDVRIKNIPTEAMRDAIMDAIKDSLPDDFYILLESTHIHIAHRPDV